ncbi:MAG TPA: Rieske 2Fe-2S domain-containing protein [Coriobacteriia bacterium]
MSESMKLIEAAQVPEGTMKEVDADGHPLMVANVAGTFYVADGRCPHLGGHMAEGTLQGAIVTCPRHGSQFDLTDGHVVRWTHFTGATLSMVELAKHPRPLRVYEAAVLDGSVMVGPQKEPAVAL